MVEYDQYDAKGKLPLCLLIIESKRLKVIAYISNFLVLRIADIPSVPTPPNPNCVAPQMAYQPPNPMGKTESKGNGFWSGL